MANSRYSKHAILLNFSRIDFTKRFAVIHFPSFCFFRATVCWVPFFCVNIVAAFCKTCIGGQTFKILSWLGYSNSAFNPIIYSIFNTEFREAFKRILTTKAAFCCHDDLNLHCRNSERFVTDYQSANKCSHIHSGRSSAELEQVSAI